VVVVVKCGYGNTPEKTPEAAQLLILGKLVERFDPATRTERDTMQSAFLDNLLDGLKTYAFIQQPRKSSILMKSVRDDEL